MLNFATLSPTDAIGYLVELFSDKRTRRQRPLLHGEPGIGKTRLVGAVARLLNAELRPLHLQNLEAPDIRGLTMIDVEAGVTRHMRPEWLPEYTDDPDAPLIVLFLDEILAVHDSVRKAAFELLTEHRIGPFKLGANVVIIAACNTAEDGTIIYEMDSATADRFCHCLIETTIEGFIEHGQQEGYHPAILAFIANHADCFLPSDEDKRNGTIARPSPRSLERCSESLYRGFSKPLYRDVNLKGWLGNYAGGLLITDLDDEDARFDLQKLLNASPDQREYPTSQFGVYNLAQSLAAYADSADKLDRAVDVMMSMPDTLNGAIEECKTAFFFAVAEKLRQWRLLAKYSKDARVLPFLERTDQIIDEADQAHQQQLEEDAGEAHQQQLAA